MKNLNFAAIHHIPHDEYRYTLSTGEVSLLLRTEKDNWDRVFAIVYKNYGEEFGDEGMLRLPMEKFACDDMYDYYRVVFMPNDPRFKYVFELDSSSIKLYYTYDGIKTYEEITATSDIPVFMMSYAYPAEPKPAWSRGAIAYQIFPDRFSRTGRLEPGMEKWDSPNIASDRIFGGNLKGILARVPYLKRLNVKIVYLTPIFQSDTAHRYNTFDYFQVDSRLGDEKDLRNLAKELHKNDMYLVLDGVFNHSGIGFEPFRDVMEKKEKSLYYDWFFFGAKESPACGYACFASEPSMPKLNLKNPAAAEYFATVGRYWIEKCGVDGWRLDVSPEVYPDFWRKFRREIKEINPNAIMIAECWHDARMWCNNGDMFDSTMNYVWSKAVWGLFGSKTLSISEANYQINKNYVRYHMEVNDLQWNMLGSHDTERFLHRAGEKLESLEAAAFYQMTSPGTPVIYYGDEIGMTGANDPYCRYPMRWDKTEDSLVLRYYKLLTQLRSKYEALQTGLYKTFLVDEEQGIFAYTRSLYNDTLLCIICAKELPITKATIKIPNYVAKRIYLRDEVSGERFNCAAATLVLPYKYGRCYCFPISKTLDTPAKEKP